jgi:hypothetical protein
MTDKIYTGEPPCFAFRFRVAIIMHGTICSDLEPRRDLIDFGDGGFSWGQDEAGRNLLALSLTADAVDDETAIAAYETFGRAIFEFMPPYRCWRLCENTVAAIARSCVQRVIGRAA